MPVIKVCFTNIVVLTSREPVKQNCIFIHLVVVLCFTCSLSLSCNCQCQHHSTDALILYCQFLVYLTSSTNRRTLVLQFAAKSFEEEERSYHRVKEAFPEDKMVCFKFFLNHPCQIKVQLRHYG